MSRDSRPDQGEEQAFKKQTLAVEQLHGLIIQGSKALSLLNAGAVVALLAFLQALIVKPNAQLTTLKSYLVFAFACYLLGAVGAALTFMPHYWFINQLHNGKSTPLHKVIWFLLFASAVAWALGSLSMFLGIQAII